MAKEQIVRTNEVGNKYGKLLVLEYVGQSKSRQAMWRCLCDCGKTIVTRGTSLRTGGALSCGCSQDSPDGAFNTLYTRIKIGAIKRNYIWKLSKDDVREITSEPCFYCGTIPSKIVRNGGMGKGRFEYVYNGIDRIDSSRGYEIDNVVPCCWKCNRAKSTLSVRDFKDWIIQVYSHWISK